MTHLIQTSFWMQVHTGDSSSDGVHGNTHAPAPASYPGMSFMILDSIVARAVCVFVGVMAWQKIAGGENEAPSRPSAARPRVARAAGLGFAVIVLPIAGAFFSSRTSPRTTPDARATASRLWTEKLSGLLPSQHPEIPGPRWLDRGKIGSQTWYGKKESLQRGRGG